MKLTSGEVDGVARLAVRRFICYVAIHYDVLYWCLACCATYTALSTATATHQAADIGARILGTAASGCVNSIQYFLNGRESRDYVPKAARTAVNERLLPRVYGRRGVTAVTRSIRYICSGSKAVIYEGCSAALEMFLGCSTSLLRSSGSVQRKLEKCAGWGVGHFYAFVVGRHTAISGADGKLGAVELDDLIPPKDKGTGAVIAGQMDWATALPNRSNVQCWSKGAAKEARTTIPLTLAQLEAEEDEEVRNDDKVICLFKMAKALASVTNGVPVGEACGCDLRWATGNVHELEAPYVGSEEGWSLADERQDWPWLIAAGPGKVRSVRLDLSSDTAYNQMLTTGLLSASQTATPDEARAICNALRYANTDKAV